VGGVERGFSSHREQAERAERLAERSSPSGSSPSQRLRPRHPFFRTRRAPLRVGRRAAPALVGAHGFCQARSAACDRGVLRPPATIIPSRSRRARGAFRRWRGEHPRDTVAASESRTSFAVAMSTRAGRDISPRRRHRAPIGARVVRSGMVEAMGVRPAGIASGRFGTALHRQAGLTGCCRARDDADRARGSSCGGGQPPQERAPARRRPRAERRERSPGPAGGGARSLRRNNGGKRGRTTSTPLDCCCVWRQHVLVGIWSARPVANCRSPSRDREGAVSPTP